MSANRVLLEQLHALNELTGWAGIAERTIRQQTTEIERVQSVLGDLVDALSDDLALEVSHSSTVQALVREAISVLYDPGYDSYLDEWWLSADDERVVR